MYGSYIDRFDIARICNDVSFYEQEKLKWINPSDGDMADYFFGQMMNGNASRLNILYNKVALDYIREFSPTLAHTVELVMQENGALHLGSPEIMDMLFPDTKVADHYEGMLIPRDPDSDNGDVEEPSSLYTCRLMTIVWNRFWEALHTIASGAYAPYDMVTYNKPYRLPVHRAHIREGVIAGLAFCMETYCFWSAANMFDCTLRGFGYVGQYRYLDFSNR